MQKRNSIPARAFSVMPRVLQVMPRALSVMSLALVMAGVRCLGQAAPAATASVASTPSSPHISWLDGTVHYALTGTELFQHGYYGSGVTTTTGISGSVGYTNLSQTHPFSMLFMGGLLFGQGGQGVTTFQNLSLSQSLIAGKWMLGVNDSFTFLPQSPTVGYTGIAGVGSIGTVPIQGPSYGPAGGVLTYSGNRIGNSLGGTIERRLTGRTSISGNAGWTVLHFLDKNAGLDTTALTGQVGLNHRINLRNSVSLSAVYSTFDTSGLFNNLPGVPYNNVTYLTKGLNLTYQRQWTRALSTEISAGPQWISSSSAQVVPARTNAYANAGIAYSKELTSFGMNYNHGVNAGSGIFAGAESDSVTGTVGHHFGRYWMASASASYTRTTGLLSTTPAGTVANNGAINTQYGGVQLMHGFTRTISGYVTYNAQNQDVNSSLATQSVYRGLSHTVGIGVSWTPQSTRLGDF